MTATAKLRDYINAEYVFHSFAAGVFTYKMADGASERFFVTIPVEEIGTATLQATERGAVLMKWIRATLKTIDDARAEQG